MAKQLTTKNPMVRLHFSLIANYRRWFAAIATGVLVCVSACNDPAEPDTPLLPADQIFWSLTLNYKAVNLAMAQPYDTVRLVAVPRNVYGDILPNAPAATFLPSADLAIAVASNGLIRAVNQTGPNGIRAVATLTYGGVTRTDTAFICVTNVPSPQAVKTFSIAVQPGDSLIVSASGILADSRSKRLRIITTDTNGIAIPRVIAFYETSAPGVATVNRQTGLTSIQFHPGTFVVRASALVYGVVKSDSLPFTVTNSLSGTITLKKSKLESHVTLLRGGDMAWINATTDSIDIVFDDSLAVQRPFGSTLIGMLYGDAAGNIAPFAGDPSFTLNQISTLGPVVVRVRSFPVPGTYKYTSRRNPNVRGTVHVL